MNNEEMTDLLGQAKILLKATTDLLEKQESNYYVLNLLEETVFYDGAECDGNCLKNDIDYWFYELEEQNKTKTKPIDKIRAEIENLEEGITSYYNDRPWVYKDEVLQIIDKYKPEMEMKEGRE